MNYGRYFRMNQALSKVVSGVTVYDYVDLPAYFGPSEQNPMSPKYPISVTITSNSVCFRLHYSAFKLDKSGDGDFPQYAYDKDDIDKKALNRKQVDIGMAHMEEMILELLYNESISNNLSDTIKKIYDTTFPQVIDENTSMGGRFLEQLIKKRYPINKGEVASNDIESQLYQELRKVSDETASYSTLWLMDLVREDRIYLYSKQKIIDDKTKKKKEIDVITGFLRKLLLDFMFDLKHSDVFQNSACYTKMYSGLMSDFFFSALMHKCEYYYYRKLTKQAIGKARKEDRNRITELYASELNKAEEQWINDIMSLQAEKHFEHHNRANIWYQELFGHNSFACWPSWFAEPEEEMRRVCFTMIEKTNGKKIKHICNTETLVELLGLERQSSRNVLAVKMIQSRDELSERISKWFLKRYDFNDVIHLHIAKHFNFIIFVFVFCFLLYLFRAYDNLFSLVSFLDSSSVRVAVVMTLIMSFIIILVYDFWREYNYRNHSGITGKDLHISQILLREKKWSYVSWASLVIGLTLLLFYWRGFWQHANSIWLSFVQLKCWSVIADSVCKMGLQEYSLIATVIFLLVLLFNWICGLYVFKLSIARKVITVKKLFGCLLVVALFCCAYLYYPILGKSLAISALIVFFVVFYSNQWLGIMPTIHPISSLHLLFPRLVAAITAAWFAMSMGFDIYVSFFDALPAWYTALAISIIVLGFIMYEINRIMPSASSIRKLYRSFEFLVISYSISLLVGLVVINFVGEKFLERGGYMQDYYGEYVKDNGKSSWNPFVYKMNEAKDTSSVYGKVQALSKVSHKAKNESFIMKTKILNTDHDFFFMRDFLIMFSFIAMFWGIFIQMIFTGEKQMTEL